MRLSIRNKLAAVISLLLLLVFSIAAYLFVGEKKEEIAGDILNNALAFSELTAERVVDDYELYLEENSFVYFNREIGAVFAQNADTAAISVISYSGDVVYDSVLDKDSRYEGDGRVVDADLLMQVQSENISVRMIDDAVFYLKGEKFVDLNEKEIIAPEPGLLADYIVVPATEDFSVKYTLDYSTLEARVNRMVMRIVYLAIFAIMLGMALSFLMAKRVTQPISSLVTSAGQISKGNFKAKVDINTKDEISDLGDSFNKMADKLGESMEARVYQARVTHELSMATRIQERLVPDEVPVVSGLDIAAGLIPAEEIGGDIYDFLPVENNKLRMYLGDVTGHGVPSGIVSSLANALFYGFRHVAELDKVMIKVNEVLKAKTMPTMFMTLCLMDFDIESGRLQYISAGHEQIIHYKGKTKEVELAPAGGVALGMVEDMEPHAKVHAIDFEVGDFVVIYSDGIPEAWKSKSESYGMERFMTAVQKFGDIDSAMGIKEAILADVEQFANGYPQMDDITVMVIKRVK